MGRLQPRIINIRGIVAETGPIGVGAPASQPVFSSMSVMVLKHDNFINQIIALDRCFGREDIIGFAPEELEEHIAIALRDNYIIEDGNSGRYCSGQVAWRLKELTKGYVYERL
jgi:hypothetical protein